MAAEWWEAGMREWFAGILRERAGWRLVNTAAVIGSVDEPAVFRSWIGERHVRQAKIDGVIR